jgi:putative Mg2+ transporter-C (MgtC) family protein
MRLDNLDPLASPFWISVGMAVLCGAIVGLERQVRGKAAGARTSILICLGTSIFIQLGGSALAGQGDPSRVLGQLVTGVGFLGAGVIISREGVVSGVTTAAVSWVLAATGAAIGLGHHLAALALAFVTVAVLTGIDFLEKSVRWLTQRKSRDD